MFVFFFSSCYFLDFKSSLATLRVPAAITSAPIAMAAAAPLLCFSKFSIVRLSLSSAEEEFDVCSSLLIVEIIKVSYKL